MTAPFEATRLDEKGRPVHWASMQSESMEQAASDYFRHSPVAHIMFNKGMAVTVRVRQVNTGRIQLSKEYTFKAVRS